MFYVIVVGHGVPVFFCCKTHGFHGVLFVLGHCAYMYSSVLIMLKHEVPNIFIVVKQFLILSR